MIQVYCFDNGNVAVFGPDGKQVLEAQTPWILEVAGNLPKAGLNPLDAEIHLSDNRKAEFFEADGSFSWRIL